MSRYSMIFHDIEGLWRNNLASSHPPEPFQTFIQVAFLYQSSTRGWTSVHRLLAGCTENLGTPWNTYSTNSKTIQTIPNHPEPFQQQHIKSFNLSKKYKKIKDIQRPLQQSPFKKNHYKSIQRTPNCPILVPHHFFKFCRASTDPTVLWQWLTGLCGLWRWHGHWRWSQFRHSGISKSCVDTVVCMDLYGYVWNYMNMSGHVWTSVEICVQDCMD